MLVSYDLMVPGEGEAEVLEKVRSFLTGRGIEFDNYLFDDDDYDRINDWLDLPGPIPVTLAIDAAGEIVDTHEDRAGRARFEEMIERALRPQ